MTWCIWTYMQWRYGFTLLSQDCLSHYPSLIDTYLSMIVLVECKLEYIRIALVSQLFISKKGIPFTMKLYSIKSVIKRYHGNTAVLHYLKFNLIFGVWWSSSRYVILLDKHVCSAYQNAIVCDNMRLYGGGDEAAATDDTRVQNVRVRNQTNLNDWNLNKYWNDWYQIPVYRICRTGGWEFNYPCSCPSTQSPTEFYIRLFITREREIHIIIHHRIQI